MAFAEIGGEAHPHFLHKNTPKKRKTRKHIIPDFRKMTCFLLCFAERTGPKAGPNFFSSKAGVFPYFFRLSSTATATETVIPTMGLLPAPKKPIISTWAGTEEEPAN